MGMSRRRVVGCWRRGEVGFWFVAGFRLDYGFVQVRASLIRWAPLNVRCFGSDPTLHEGTRNKSVMSAVPAVLQVDGLAAVWPGHKTRA
jgi:hypothetical protein